MPHLNYFANKYRLFLISFSVVALFVSSKTAMASCGSAFCSVNTQWDVQGINLNSGTQIGLRYESIKQDQLREGQDKRSLQDVTAEEHAEIETKNQNWIMSIDHAFNNVWGVTVTVPYLDRHHEHIHDPSGVAEDEHWEYKEPGDISVIGKYKPSINNLRYRFGVKLPTGKYDITNDHGEEAERSMQPGTGTSDLILGVYYNNRTLKSPSSWFVGATVQQAINNRDDFKPGQHFSVDGGFNYAASKELGYMVQINTMVKEEDSGANSEPEESGGEFIFLSPGISVMVSPAIQLYGFFQQPLYQHVNGVQLTADYGFVMGINGRL